jgi:hypothetical protein
LSFLFRPFCEYKHVASFIIGDKKERERREWKEPGSKVLIKVVSARANGGEERLERDDEWRTYIKKKERDGKKRSSKLILQFLPFFKKNKIILFWCGIQFILRQGEEKKYDFFFFFFSVFDFSPWECDSGWGGIVYGPTRKNPEPKNLSIGSVIVEEVAAIRFIFFSTFGRGFFSLSLLFTLFASLDIWYTVKLRRISQTIRSHRWFGKKREK